MNSPMNRDTDCIGTGRRDQRDRRDFAALNLNDVEKAGSPTCTSGLKIINCPECAQNDDSNSHSAEDKD